MNQNRSSMRRQVLLLATAQALFQTASVIVMAVGGLAGAVVSGDPRLATAPIAAMFLGSLLVLSTSTFLAGGIAAALLGPTLGNWGAPLLSPAYVGSFLLLSAVSLAAALLLTRLQVPAAAVVHVGSARPLAQIVRQTFTRAQTIRAPPTS